MARRVLLIHSNRERAPQPGIPLGLCLIASALEAQGCEPRIADLCFALRLRRELARALADWRPELIGLSVRNLDNGEYLRTRNYVSQAVAMVRACREHSAAPLVLGGPAVSIALAEMLERMGADYAVSGEGEQVMPELVQQLADG